MPRARPMPPEILGDGTLADAGRLLNLSEADMRAKLAALVARGFPPADDTTGMIDLDAVLQWRRLRHPTLFGLMQHQPGAQDAALVVSGRIRGMFKNAEAGR